MSTTYLFASGKGGAGKSTLTANLSILLAEKGKRVVLIDADLGLRSQDLLLGLENSVVYDLVDVAAGRCALEQALLEAPAAPGLHLLPAAQFARAKDLDPKKLGKIIARLQKNCDLILIDCPAGLERGLRNVLNAGCSPETVLVATPDDLSIRDAEQVITLTEGKKLSRPSLIVNRIRNDLVYSGEMYSARTVAELLDVPLLGEIPEDRAFCLAQLRHKHVVDYDCEARNALMRISGRMLGEEQNFPEYGKRRSSFFRRHFEPELREVKRQI